jgi:hypothetical protein
MPEEKEQTQQGGKMKIQWLGIAHILLVFSIGYWAGSIDGTLLRWLVLSGLLSLGFIIKQHTYNRRQDGNRNHSKEI